MTILKCSATTCVYNKDQLCSKGEIDVMGDCAHEAGDTCCGSFKERGEGSPFNNVACGGGCDSIEIDCKAQHCTYNDQCKCTASSIQVAGDSACTCKETRCNTFECE